MASAARPVRSLTRSLSPRFAGTEDDLQGDRVQFLVLLDGEKASLSAAFAMMSEGFASADEELFAGELRVIIEGGHDFHPRRSPVFIEGGHPFS